MPIPAELLQAFPPSATRLLDVARRDLDDELVMWIASADYGYMADEFFLQLQRIRHIGEIPPLDNWLSEVLELIRWCDPNDPNLCVSKHGPDIGRGHRARFFACAVLLAASANPATRYRNVSGDDATLAPCIGSAMELGGDRLEAVGSFLAWRLTNAEPGVDWLWYAVSLLTLALRLPKKGLPEASLGKFANAILEVELSLSRAQGRWLYTREPAPLAFSIQQGFWQPIVDRLQAEFVRIEDDDVRLSIQLCAMILDP